MHDYVGKDVGNVGKENEFVTYKPNDIKIKILEAMEDNNTITIPELSMALNVTERQTQRIIKRLRDKLLLERKGGRKQGYWEIKKSRDNPIANISNDGI